MKSVHSFYQKAVRIYLSVIVHTKFSDDGIHVIAKKALLSYLKVIF